MIARILWSFVLVATLYVLAVFFVPAKADELADVFGIKSFNLILREAKSGGAEDIKMNLDSGSGGYLNELQGTVNDARKAVEATKATMQTKVEQTKKVVNSVQKTAGAIEELKSSVSDLTSLTGSTASGSTSTGKTLSASGSASTRKTK